MTRKSKRHRRTPIDLTLDELGLLSHIITHLVDGKFEHRNFDIGVIFGLNKSTVSRIIDRLEKKGAIDIERDPKTGERPHDPLTGRQKIAVITPRELVAPVHPADCSCYQNLKSPSVTVANKTGCNGAHHIELLSTRDSISKRSELLGAPVHPDLAAALDAARVRLQKTRDAQTSNFDAQANKYHAQNVREARAEVRRLEELLEEGAQ